MDKIKLQDTKECYLCRIFGGDGICLPNVGLENHHIFYGTANRKNSDKYGLVVWLCHGHHRTWKSAVHRCKESDAIVKRNAQMKFEEEYSREEFVDIFGKSWV